MPDLTELTDMTAAEMAEQLQTGAFTATQLTQAHLDRIEAVDERINAFIRVDPESALAAAEDVDKRRAAGEELPPLAGVPVAVKDNIVTRGMATTAGSRILEGWVPPYDAHVVEKLRENGLVIIGKTNLDEFAMGSSGEHSAFGPTRNPRDEERVPCLLYTSPSPRDS